MRTRSWTVQAVQSRILYKSFSRRTVSRWNKLSCAVCTVHCPLHFNIYFTKHVCIHTHPHASNTDSADYTVTGLHTRSRIWFDTMVLAYRITTVHTDIFFFDIPEMARYVSSIDIPYVTAVPAWLEDTRSSGMRAR